MIVYGIAQIGMLALLVGSLSTAPPDETEPKQRLREDGARLAKAGVAVGALSIVLWAVDSSWCDDLVRAREVLGPLSALTQLHGLWHLGSGLCAHLAGVPVMIVWLARDPTIAVRLRTWRGVVWWLERVDQPVRLEHDTKVGAG